MDSHSAGVYYFAVFTRLVEFRAHGRNACPGKADGGATDMLIAGIVVAAGVLMILTELAAPGRRWPKVAGWWFRAILLNCIQAATVYVSSHTWDIWLRGASIWQAELLLGVEGGAVVGYLVITFIYYWWHRARHQVPALWRIFHQMHHSPQRIEIITSFYKHPAEIIVNGMLSSAILYVLCGLGPASASLAVLLTGLAELFYHWNVRTPYWLGFIFQRPESHCIHHKMDWHRQNYADLPVWDMLFGTFHNPRRFAERCGFADLGERRIGELLRGIDIYSQNEDAASP